MVKVGVVGTGSIFQRMHLPSYPEVQDAQVVALADVSEKNLNMAKKLLQAAYEEKAKKLEDIDAEAAESARVAADSITTYASLDVMLDKEDVELLDICTPPKYHVDAIKAAERGIAVMVEKPMAFSYLEAEKIWQAVKDNRTFYQHNEQEVFDPLYYTSRKVIQGGALGELAFMSISFAHFGPESRRWFWDEEVSGGGSLVDMATHSITVAWFLAGFEKKIASVKSAAPIGISRRVPQRIIQGEFREFNVEDDAHLLLRFEGEHGDWITALLEGSWTERDSLPFFVQGTTGRLSIKEEATEKVLLLTDNFGYTRTIGLPRWAAFEMELSNAVACVKEGARSISNEDVGLGTTAAMGAAYLSEIKGRAAVTLEEFQDYAHTFSDGLELVKALIKGVKEGSGV